jgi:HlyD family secretion protein
MVSVSPANRLFRKAALDRLASPEQLDDLVTVTDGRGWIATLGLCVLAVALVAWGFLGRIPTEVVAQGILVMQGGRVVGAVSPGSGVVAALAVKAGDLVHRGQPVATIRQTSGEVRLANAEQAVVERAEQLRVREAALKDQAAALEANATQRRAAQEQIIAQANERLQRLQRQIGILQDLRAQNLVLEARVEQVRGEIASARQDISNARAQLVGIDTDLLKSRLDSDRELSGLRQALEDARRGVTDQRSSLTEARDVLAPADGRVTEVTVSEGQLIIANALVLNVETEGNRLQAVVYVPTQDGKKVTRGMGARIAPSTVKKEEWGTLSGSVAGVSDFPSTPQGMAAVLQNQQLVQSFGGQGSPYEARIDLRRAATPTGYAWSSGKGPDLDLTSGTTVEADITVREDAPINLIVPFMLRAAGMSR